MKSRLLFLASLWMAICVALLSALAPLGPPASRLMGSAFNPATTSVVLKARSPAAAPAVRLMEPDGAGQGTPALPVLHGLLAVAPLLIAIWALQHGALHDRALPHRSGLSLLSLRRARAPPFPL